MADRRDIKFRLSTIDRFSETKTFRTLEGAKTYVKKRLGDHYDVGMGYAVDMFGTGKLVILGGTTWTELLGYDPLSPPDALPDPPRDDGGYDNGVHWSDPRADRGGR